MFDSNLCTSCHVVSWGLWMTQSMINKINSRKAVQGRRASNPHPRFPGQPMCSIVDVTFLVKEHVQSDCQTTQSINLIDQQKKIAQMFEPRSLLRNFWNQGQANGDDLAALDLNHPHEAKFRLRCDSLLNLEIEIIYTMESAALFRNHCCWRLASIEAGVLVHRGNVLTSSGLHKAQSDCLLAQHW